MVSSPSPEASRGESQSDKIMVVNENRNCYAASEIFFLDKRIFWSIVFNWAIVYKHQNFLNIVVHVIDQFNQTIQVTVIYSTTIFGPNVRVLLIVGYL